MSEIENNNNIKYLDILNEVLIKFFDYFKKGRCSQKEEDYYNYFNEKYKDVNSFNYLSEDEIFEYLFLDLIEVVKYLKDKADDDKKYRYVFVENELNQIIRGYLYEKYRIVNEKVFKIFIDNVSKRNIIRDEKMFGKFIKENFKDWLNFSLEKIKIQCVDEKLNNPVYFIENYSRIEEVSKEQFNREQIIKSIVCDMEYLKNYSEERKKPIICIDVRNEYFFIKEDLIVGVKMF